MKTNEDIKVGDKVTTVHSDGFVLQWYVISIVSKTRVLLGAEWDTPKGMCYAYDKSEVTKV